MLNFLYYLFPPVEVKLCLSALDHVSALFENQMFYDGIKEEVIASLKNQNSKAQLMKLVHTDNMKPSEVALDTIAETCFKRLSHGYGYLYRGLLTMEGSSWRAIFCICIRELEKMGRHKKEDADKYIATLDGIIKECG